MGVAISSQSSLAPVSLASTIIGFISFAFTVLTAIRVFWSNISTIRAAPTEVPDFLGNLKQALYEERAHLRLVKKSFRTSEHYDEGGFKVLSDTVKHMIRDFKHLERPFLVPDRAAYRTWWGYEEPDDLSREGAVRGDVRYDPGRHERGSRKRRSRSSYSREEGGRHGYNGNIDRDKARTRHIREEDDYYATDYCKIGLMHRYIWLKNRSQVLALLEAITRIQTRRIAKQMCEVAIAVQNVERRGRQADESIGNMQERLSRVVGVRRMD
ncbi:MAG: hypothetical protein M1820_007155 [Bogoriella megaspora]|nr:MAG: hypothetical protein M1820_007155 [Bogoriella megaspora]